MHRLRFLGMGFLGMVLFMTLGTALPAAAGDLTLRRVMLSTGGVGYFEYEAMVSGDALLSLEVRRDQVDDVMKSIVVYDDKGGIGEISLPGQEPLREVFREMPFGPDALESPVSLLNALRGAEVRASGPREVSGRVVAVTEESAQLPGGGGTIARHRLSLMTPDGMRQLILEEADTLRFTDARLQAQVNAALTAIAQNGERDRRRLSIRTSGIGERTVRVGYVIEVPLWKTTYRLTLSGTGQGALQGWAVIENLSGEAWKDVELTVASGNPVTFRQALYTAYYVNRPEVPVEVLGRVLPKVDEGAIAGRAAFADAAPEADESPKSTRAMAPPPPSSPAPMMAARPSPATTGAGAPPPPPPPAQLAEVKAAESSEATTQVVFRFPTPVSVAGGNSLLLPIVSRPVPAARLAQYQPSTHPAHPLAAVRLTNDGPSGLPPGILTLYERGESGAAAYVGDARLAALPAGEERLISFALDQKVKIDRADQSTQTLAKAKLVDGVLHLTLTERAATTYTISGAAREDRTVIIEHPRRTGWNLALPADAKPDLTPTAYRLSIEVPAGKTAALTVALERPRVDRVELVNLSGEQIDYYVRMGELSQPIRDAVARLAGFRATVNDRQRSLTALERDLGEVTKDQERLRQNLGSVPTDSDLQRRYLAKLSEQEDRLEKLADDISAARAAFDAARQALIDYARGLKL